MNLDFLNELSQGTYINNSVTVESQNNFLQSTIGQAVNMGLDLGIKYLLPDFIEDDIIEIKDVLLQEGLKEGIEHSIEKVIETGKNIIGVFTGKFENISQAEEAISKGGIIDEISSSVDFILNKLKDFNILSKDVINIIKSGKNILLENIENKIKDNIEDSEKKIAEITNYTNIWEKAFKEENIEIMNKTYANIKNNIDNIFPLDNIFNKINEIENLQKIVTNNGGNFNLSQEQLELAKILT